MVDTGRPVYHYEMATVVYQPMLGQSWLVNLMGMPYSAHIIKIFCTLTDISEQLITLTYLNNRQFVFLSLGLGGFCKQPGKNANNFADTNRKYGHSYISFNRWWWFRGRIIQTKNNINYNTKNSRKFTWNTRLSVDV